MGIGDEIDKIKVIHFVSFLSMIVVMIRNNIPRIIFCVKKPMVLILKILVKLGEMRTTANQAAERLPVTEDSALRKARFFLVTKTF